MNWVLISASSEKQGEKQGISKSNSSLQPILMKDNLHAYIALISEPNC